MAYEMTVFQNIRKGLTPARVSVDDVYALTRSGILMETDNFELLEGEIVPMAAVKANWHEQMKSKLIRALVRSIPEDTRLFVEPSITLAEATLVEPDLAIWPVGGNSQKVRGADLLLVIEVSDSSLGYDLRIKAPLYAQHGIREYWVVDAVRETIRVHRDPHGGVYSDVEEREADVAVAPLLLSGVRIRLDALD